ALRGILGDAVLRAVAPRRRRRGRVAAHRPRESARRGRVRHPRRRSRDGCGLATVATSPRRADSLTVPVTIATAVRRRVWLIAAVVVGIAVSVALVWRPWSDSGFVEHRMLRRTDIPAAVAVAPDGAVWFAIEMSDAIGVLRDGRIQRVSKGTQNLEMIGLGIDADGGVWFTDASGRAVSRMAADGSVRSFPLATPVAKLGRLAVAPDNAVWFADLTTASVTRLKDGVFTRHVS